MRHARTGFCPSPRNATALSFARPGVAIAVLLGCLLSARPSAGQADRAAIGQRLRELRADVSALESERQRIDGRIVEIGEVLSLRPKVEARIASLQREADSIGAQLSRVEKVAHVSATRAAYLSQSGAGNFSLTERARPPVEPVRSGEDLRSLVVGLAVLLAAGAALAGRALRLPGHHVFLLALGAGLLPIAALFFIADQKGFEASAILTHRNARQRNLKRDPIVQDVASFTMTWDTMTAILRKHDPRLAGKTPLTLERGVRSLASRVRFEGGSAGTVRVVCRDTDPVRAATIANALAERFIVGRVADAHTDAQRSHQVAAAHQASLAKQFASIQTRIREIKMENDSVLKADTLELSEVLSELKQRRRGLDREMGDKKRRIAHWERLSNPEGTTF
jgi:hypothetical protein